MKTKKFTKRFFSILFITGLILSCSSEDGADGATGPQGEQGPAGAQGDQGEQGDQGDTGTANVIYSDWIPDNFAIGGAQPANLMDLGTLSATELNRATDVVLVYGQRDTETLDAGIYALPFILATQDEYYGFIFFESGEDTALQVRVNSLDGGSNLFTFFTEYRYVIIPGGNLASGKSSIDYTKMTYEEVAAHFGIKE